MSSVIEQKILEMRFDNKQFEDNVAESISTLDKLKGALNFDKVTDSFGTVTAAAGKVDLSPISNGVESVIVKFNALEMAAVQAVANIITNGIDKLSASVNHLTLDNLGEGWGKFEEKTGSVQTIMSATGKTIEEVEQQLERLNWFSDETSYSFTDMTSNVGKFTSVGVDLEKAVSAMEGISTWAALSGSSVQEASRAMYNLSQAMGVGAVKLMDWRSIENAGMATTAFKEVVMDTAVAMGTLNKFTDGTYETLKGVAVGVSNFSSTLSEGWFTDQVLIEALDTYGSFANELSAACTALDVETSDFKDALESYNGSAESLLETSQEMGVSVDELLPYVEKLSADEYELGRKAFWAAQEAKTLSEAIEATTDAASTKWMNIYEAIFGNYEEAKAFFSDLADVFYDIFVEPVDQLKKFTKAWSNFGAEDGPKAAQIFRDGLLDVLISIQNVIEFIRDRFERIIPPLTVEQVANITGKFGEFAANLKEYTANMEIPAHIWRGIKTFILGVGDGFGILFDTVEALKPAFDWLLGIFGKVFTYFTENILYTFGRGLTYLREYIQKNELLEKAIDRVGQIFGTAYRMISVALKPLSDLISPVIEKLESIFSLHNKKSDFINYFDKVRAKLESIFNLDVDTGKLWYIAVKIRFALEDIIKFLTDIYTQVTGFVTNSHLGDFLAQVWEHVKNIVSKAFSLLDKLKLSTILNWISSVSGALFDLLGKINLDSVLTHVTNFGSKVVGVFSNMFSGLKEAFSTFDLGKHLSDFGNSLKSVFGGEGGGFDFATLMKNLTQGVLLFQGFNLGKLFGSAAGGIDAVTGGLKEGGIGGLLKGLISPVTDVFDQLKETIGSFTKDTDSDKLMSIAVAVGVMTAALVVLASVDSDKMFTALEGLGGILGGLFLEMKGLAGLDFTKSGKQFKNIGLAMAEIAVAALLMAEAVKPFADMDGTQIAKSMAVMTAILTEFLVFTAIFGKISQANQVGNVESKGIFGLFQKSNGFDKQLKNVGVAMIELGAAMKIFASALADLGNIKDMSTAIGAFTAVIGELLIFIAVASKLNTKDINKVAVAMIELGAAMKIFASAMIDMSTIDNILTSISGMAAVTAAMAAFLLLADAFAKESGQILVIAASMIVLGVAMKTFASSLIDMGGLDTKQLVIGIAGMTDAMIKMGLFMVAAEEFVDSPGKITVVAAAMVVLGIAMKKFASAMHDFAEMEPAEWFNALVQMTACFAEMLIFMAVANAVAAQAPMITVLAAAMIVLGLAMKTFASSAKDFESVNWTELAKAGAVLGGVIVAIGALAAIGTVAGAGLAVVATSLLAIGGAIALIGVGVAALNIGSFVGRIADLTQRLVWLSDAATSALKAFTVKEAVDAFVAILLALPRVVTGVISGIVAGVIEGFGTILSSVGGLLEGLKETVFAFLDFVGATFPKVIDTLLDILLNTLTSLLEKAPEIITTFLDLIIKVLEGLVQYAPKIIELVADLICKILDGLTEHIPEIVKSFMNFIGAVFGEVMNVVQNTDAGTVSKIEEMFLALMGAIVVLDLIKGMIPGAMAGLLGVSGFVAELAVIIAAFGALNEIPGFHMLVDEGGDLLMAIGTAIGKFVGGLLGGFMEGATDQLPKIGLNIALFWLNVKPFIDGVSKIGMDTVEKVGILSASILVLTVSDFIDSIVDFQRKLTNAGDFGSNIASLWRNIQPFMDGMSNVKKSTVESVELLAKAILTITAADLVKGIGDFIFGKSDIDSFGESLSSLGPYLKTFSDSVTGIDTMAVKTASQAIHTIADAFGDDKLRTGGVIQWFKGENSDLVEFGRGLVKLGPCITQYAASVAGIDLNIVSNSAKAGKAIAELASTLPMKGGVVGELKGESDLVDFAKGLAALGPSLMSYAKSVVGLDVNVVSNSIAAAQAINELAKGLPDKTLTDTILKRDKMQEFCTSLQSLGTSLKTYFDDVKNISAVHIVQVQTAIMSMINMFTDDNNDYKVNKSFTKALQEAASNGISAFVKTIDDMLPFVIQEGTAITNALMTGIDAQTNNLIALVNEIISKIIARFSSNMTTFKRYGTNLMASFNSGIGGMISTIDACVGNIIQQMKTTLSADTLKAWFRSAAEDLMTYFTAGIITSTETVMIAVSMMGQTALSQLTSTELLNSFTTAGSNVGASFANGMNSQQANVISAANSLSSNAQAVVNSGLNDMQSRLESIMSMIDYNPVITPVIDLTDAERALDGLTDEYRYLESKYYDLLQKVQDVDRSGNVNVPTSSGDKWDGYTGTGNNGNTYQNIYFDVSGSSDPWETTTKIRRLMESLSATT